MKFFNELEKIEKDVYNGSILVCGQFTFIINIGAEKFGSEACTLPKTCTLNFRDYADFKGRLVFAECAKLQLNEGERIEYKCTFFTPSADGQCGLFLIQ